MTVSFHGSAVSSVGSLHKAIRDDDFDTVVEQLTLHPDILLIPNSIGWTALHFCAASGAITYKDWVWILGKVVTADLLSLRTDAGFTPVDLFFRSHLHPLPWQATFKERAERLSESLCRVLETSDLFDQFQKKVMELEKVELTETDEDLGRVLDFWRRLQVLLKTISREDEFNFVHSLSMTSCSKEVAQLALRLYHCSQSHALHLACRHDSTEAVLIELARYASFPENSCFPLQIALEHGKTWDTGVEALWKAHPVVTESALPPCAISPLPSILQRQIQARAVQQGMWRCLPKLAQERVLQEAREKVELQHLTTAYNLLLEAPQVCQVE
jgi:hypothetical protein